MNKVSQIKTIKDATERLNSLGLSYEKLKGHRRAHDVHLEILKQFDEAREFLSSERDRDWETESDLKAAYDSGLAVLKKAFDTYVTECSLGVISL